jgi:hypothetical protein
MHLIKNNGSGEVTLFPGVFRGCLDCQGGEKMEGFEEPEREQWNVVPCEGLDLTLPRSGFLTTMTTPQRTPGKGSHYYRRRVVTPQNHKRKDVR